MYTIRLTIGAVGDISFKGRYEDQVTNQIFVNIFANFEQVVFLVVNLESPLVTMTVGPIPGKCTLCGNTEWAAILKKC